MFRPRRKLDRYSYEWTTGSNKERIAAYRQYVSDCDTDPKRRERLDKGECRLCFYVDQRLGGASCTETECSGCGAAIHSGNTNIDTLCPTCARKWGLCKHCGGDVDDKVRRKLGFLETTAHTATDNE